MPDYIKLLNITAENIKKTDASIFVTFDVPSSLPWFDGHFPEQAVLPAVIIAEISDALTEHIYGVSPKWVASAKFKGPVYPNKNICVMLHTFNSDSVQIVWKIGKGESNESGAQHNNFENDHPLVDMKFHL